MNIGEPNTIRVIINDPYRNNNQAPPARDNGEQLERCIKALNRLKGFLASNVRTDPRLERWIEVIKEALKP